MRSLILLLGLLAGAAGATNVYRWVDENGQVHFSDRPAEGAEVLKVPEAQTFSAPPAPVRVPRPSAPDEAPPRYESLEIVRPAQEEVLWNIEGQLEVSLQLQPRLRQGDRIELYLDDQRVEGLRPGSLQVRLSEVYRGVHVLKAEVRDSQGTLLIASQPRTFAVQQTSIQNPNRAAGG